MATVIMGIAVAGLIAGLSQSVKNASRLTDYDRAAMLAHTKMNDLLLDVNLPFDGSVQGHVRRRSDRRRSRRLAGLAAAVRRASQCGPGHDDSAADRARTLVAAGQRNAPHHSAGKLSPDAHSHPGRSMKKRSPNPASR